MLAGISLDEALLSGGTKSLLRRSLLKVRDGGPDQMQSVFLIYFPNAGFYFVKCFLFVQNSTFDPQPYGLMSSNDKSHPKISFTASLRFPISGNLVGLGLQANLSTNQITPKIHS